MSIIRRPAAWPTRMNMDAFAEEGDDFMTTFPDTLDDVEAFFVAMQVAAEGGANTTLFGFNSGTTDINPTAGQLAFDNATQTSATTIRFNLADAAGNDATALLATFGASTSTIKGYMRVMKAGDGTKWIDFAVTALASPSGYRNVSVTEVRSSGGPNPFSPGDPLSVAFVRTGDKGNQGDTGNDGDDGLPGSDGIDGVSSGLEFVHLTATTATDPASGNSKFNSATMSAVTRLYISETDRLGNSVAALIATWDDSSNTVKGTLSFVKVGDPTKAVHFQVTGAITDNGAWDTVIVAYVSGPGGFANGDHIAINFARAGDVPTVTGVVPLGGMVAIANAATNPVVASDGAVFLKTGTVTTIATYPLGPKCVTVPQKPLPANPAISFGNSIFVAISGLDIWTSSDALDWTYIGATVPNGSAGLTYGAYGASTWSFPGSGGSFNTTDFITWSFNAFPNTGSVYAGPQGIIFAGSKFVAMVRNKAYCFTSSDAVTWTQRTMPSGPDWSAVAYNGSNKYVAIASSNTVSAYSADAITWTNGGALTNASGPSIAYGSGKWVAPGTGGRNADYTTDGITWTAGTTVLSGNSTNGYIFWTGTKFVIGVASDAYDYSAAGIVWTGVASNAIPAQVETMASLNLQCTDGAGKVLGYYPSDGANLFSTDDLVSWWKLNYYPSTSGVTATTAGDSTTVVAFPSGTSIYFTYKKSGLNLRSKSYASSNNAAVGASGAYDGTSWVFGPGQGNTALQSSTDGATWSARTASQSLPSSNAYHMAAIASVFIGINSTTTGTKSTDHGVTWSNVTFPVAFTKIFSITGVFLAFTDTAAGTSYYTSPDGVNWTVRTNPAAINANWPPLLNVSGTLVGGSTGTHFFSGPKLDSTGNCIYTSTDGVTWTRKAIPNQMSSTAVTSWSTASSNASGGYIWLRSASASSAVSACSDDGGTTWYVCSNAASTAIALETFMYGFYWNNNAGSRIDGSTKYVGIDRALYQNVISGNNYTQLYARVA